MAFPVLTASSIYENNHPLIPDFFLSPLFNGEFNSSSHGAETWGKPCLFRNEGQIINVVLHALGHKMHFSVGGCIFPHAPNCGRHLDEIEIKYVPLIPVKLAF
jgi:hypothetical protein